MMTVHKLSAGDGHRYYTHEVASGDQLRDADRELGDYYTVEGMPPGQWIGSGAQHLELTGEVTESQMDQLYGIGVKPQDSASIAVENHNAAQVEKAAYRTAYREQKHQAADRAWALLQDKAAGSTEEQIAQKHGVSQQSISKRIAALEAANPTLFTRQGRSVVLTPKANFMALFQMTSEDRNRARKVAHRAGIEAKNEYIEELNHARPHRAVSLPENEFTKKFADRQRWFVVQNDRQPDAKEKRQLRNLVGAQLFREEHGRDAVSNVELSKWIDTQAKPRQQSVAGFDLVFTPTKSVSIAWGLGDETLRKGIEAAHEKAIHDAMSYLEQHATYTRRGRNGVQQIDVDGGLIASKFRHWDSRNGDPNIHDHVVVANRVLGSDGKWATLDGRALYAQGVAASEVYNSKIIEHIHADLGLDFTTREQNGGVVFELAGIDQKTVTAFSSRRQSIVGSLQELEDQFIAEHGHAPTAKQRTALAQQATLATRPAKDDPKSLAGKQKQWQAKATEATPDLPTGRALLEHLRSASTEHAQHAVQAAATVSATPAAEHAQQVLEILESSRATWKSSNIEAAALRYFREASAGTGVSSELLSETVREVKKASVSLTPDAQVPVPDALRRADGASVYRTANDEVYTSQATIDAESRLIDAATNMRVQPVATQDQADRSIAAHQKRAKFPASAAQVAMATSFLTTDKLLAVGIGPAGAGKTTMSRMVVDGASSCGHTTFGLAPTAAAADVIKQDLGIDADTLDAFLMTPVEASPVHAGDVILIDEVGMVTTPKLNQIIDLAAQRGAVVRAVGDYRQLSAIGSGGALRLLEREAGATHLEDLFRFKIRNQDGSTSINDAEAEASKQLREPPVTGADKPFAWYDEQGRITAGETDVMVQQVFTAWRTDTEAGLDSLMLAPTSDQVKKLNALGQAYAAQQGSLDGSSAFRTARDEQIHVGDRVVTRRNNRRARFNKGTDFVKNGDSWTVHEIHANGVITLAHAHGRAKVNLPADYAREHVELGYARTINRAQGATVDSSHVLVTETTDRAGAYVGLTRGAYDNRLYVATGEGRSRDDVLEAIAANYERDDLSAHEQVERARTTHRDVASRVAVLQDLNEHAQTEAVKNALTQAIGAKAAQPIISSEGFSAFAARAAAAQADGWELEPALERAWHLHGMDDAQDQSAVMGHRLDLLIERDEQLRDPSSGRPFAHVPDENLTRFIDRAQKMTNPFEIPKDVELEDPGWYKREFGMVPTEQLNARRIALAETMRDNGDESYRWLMTEMDAEVTRRRWSSPAQKEYEAIVRGEKTRPAHEISLHKALLQEQRLRESLLPKAPDTQSQDLGQLHHGVSGHTADPRWLHDSHVPADLRATLMEHHQQIGELTVLRGKQLAVEQPAWTKALGPVPINPRNAARWHRVAGEVEAFRNTYQVPASEPAAVPKQLMRADRGRYLAAQVTDVHKRSTLSKRSARTTPENQFTAQTAVEKRSSVERQTPAERRISSAKLNRDRIRQMTEQLRNTKTTATSSTARDGNESAGTAKDPKRPQAETESARARLRALKERDQDRARNRWVQDPAKPRTPGRRGPQR